MEPKWAHPNVLMGPQWHQKHQEVVLVMQLDPTGFYWGIRCGHWTTIEIQWVCTSQGILMSAIMITSQYRSIYKK